ncbi:MAG: hypothetical protein WDW36_002538 [Sanguina aurantia]
MPPCGRSLPATASGPPTPVQQHASQHPDAGSAPAAGHKPAYQGSCDTAASDDEESGDLLERAVSQELEVDGGEADGAPELSASSEYSLVDEDGGGSATQVVYVREAVSVWPCRGVRITGRLSLVRQHCVTFLAWLPYSRGTLRPDGTYHVAAYQAEEGNATDRTKYAVHPIPLSDIRALRKHTPTLGWHTVVFVLSNGVTLPPLYFLKGGVKALMLVLKQHAVLIKSATDASTYLINDTSDPLQRSLSTLQLSDVIMGAPPTGASSTYPLTASHASYYPPHRPPLSASHAPHLPPNTLPPAPAGTAAAGPGCSSSGSGGVRPPGHPPNTSIGRMHAGQEDDLFGRGGGGVSRGAQGTSEGGSGTSEGGVRGGSRPASGGGGEAGGASVAWTWEDQQAQEGVAWRGLSTAIGKTLNKLMQGRSEREGVAGEKSSGVMSERGGVAGVKDSGVRSERERVAGEKSSGLRSERERVAGEKDSGVMSETGGVAGVKDFGVRSERERVAGEKGHDEGKEASGVWGHRPKGGMECMAAGVDDPPAGASGSPGGGRPSGVRIHAGGVLSSSVFGPFDGIAHVEEECEAPDKEAEGAAHPAAAGPAPGDLDTTAPLPQQQEPRGRHPPQPPAVPSYKAAVVNEAPGKPSSPTGAQGASDSRSPPSPQQQRPSPPQQPQQQPQQPQQQQQQQPQQQPWFLQGISNNAAAMRLLRRGGAGLSNAAPTLSSSDRNGSPSGTPTPPAHLPSLISTALPLAHPAARNPNSQGGAAPQVLQGAPVAAGTDVPAARPGAESGSAGGTQGEAGAGRRDSPRVSMHAMTDVGEFELLDGEGAGGELLLGIGGVGARIRARPPPLSQDEWEGMFDAEGRLVAEAAMRERVFVSGADPAIRREVYKYLLGIYSTGATAVQRAGVMRARQLEYDALRQQWMSIGRRQASRFSKWTDRRERVDKDVRRTDRALPFYAAEKGPHQTALRNMLLTYTMYNFDLGYCQGMSDLASPLLYVMRDEAEAFMCFASLMDKMGANFDEDQQGMHRQLGALRKLLQLLDPQLYAHLETHECLSLFCCFRWLLLRFKREFKMEQVLRLWEAFWSCALTPHLHLYFTAAVLIHHRRAILENPDNHPFDGLLRFCIELSGHLDLDQLLRLAEALCALAGQAGTECLEGV